MPISISWLAGSLDARLPESGEGRPNAHECDDPEHGDDDGQKQTARSHEEVKEQNIANDGREDDEGEGDIAIDQEQNGAEQLEGEYNDQIMREEESAHELGGHAGEGRHLEEVEESVQTEDEKDEAKKETGDKSGYFHMVIYF